MACEAFGSGKVPELQTAIYKVTMSSAGVHIVHNPLTTACRLALMDRYKVVID